MSKRSHQTRGIQNGAPDWSNAVRHNQFYRPVKQQTSIHLDADVLAWFKAQGKGYQYYSELYQSALRHYGICPSMTDGGLAKQCFLYQNALAERINGILKQEFLTTRCQTMKELDHLIAESIMIYNCYSAHLSLKMNTLNQMYEQTKTELIA